MRKWRLEDNPKKVFRILWDIFSRHQLIFLNKTNAKKLPDDSIYTWRISCGASCLYLRYQLRNLSETASFCDNLNIWSEPLIGTVFINKGKPTILNLVAGRMYPMTQWEESKPFSLRPVLAAWGSYSLAYSMIPPDTRRWKGNNRKIVDHLTQLIPRHEYRDPFDAEANRPTSQRFLVLCWTDFCFSIGTGYEYKSWTDVTQTQEGKYRLPLTHSKQAKRPWRAVNHYLLCCLLSLVNYSPTSSSPLSHLAKFSDPFPNYFEKWRRNDALPQE